MEQESLAASAGKTKILCDHEISFIGSLLTFRYNICIYSNGLKTLSNFELPPFISEFVKKLIAYIGDKYNIAICIRSLRSSKYNLRSCWEQVEMFQSRSFVRSLRRLQYKGIFNSHFWFYQF